VTRYAKRVDRNHHEVRDGLRALGYEVLDLSAAGCGVPDLAVKVKGKLGVVHFLEIKDPKQPLNKQALKPAQEVWHSFAHAMTSKVRSLDEATEALEWAKGRT
jgi:hypothetical protein